MKQLTAVVTPARRTVLLIWAAWVLIMIGYQFYVLARFAPERPDYALSWTENGTQADRNDDRPLLAGSTLNQHVAWDSEYYLSIAMNGYDDPAMRAIPENYAWGRYQLVGNNERRPQWVSMNYAFFPGYPYAMRAVILPLRVFGLDDLATATLAGVIVSMVGTLIAMLALHDIASHVWGDAEGIRAAFYLLIFPSSMFLAEVYTEGWFVGMSFGALALARRHNWIGAAVLAAFATWTRAAGGLLLGPLVWYWAFSGAPQRLIRNRVIHNRAWIEIGKLALTTTPLWAYLIWNASFGDEFHIIEERFFSRGLLQIDQSRDAWRVAWDAMRAGDPMQTRAYYLVEFGAIGAALLACVLLIRRFPALVLYSLGAIVFSMTSGVAQGMHRYVLAAPVLFLLPALWGRSQVFDRAWTLANVLLMGIYAAMFSFDFWAG